MLSIAYESMFCAMYEMLIGLQQNVHETIHVLLFILKVVLQAAWM